MNKRTRQYIIYWKCDQCDGNYYFGSECRLTFDKIDEIVDELKELVRKKQNKQNIKPIIVIKNIMEF